jgi:hypothetical protein
MDTIGSKSGTTIPRLHTSKVSKSRKGREGKRQTYLFIAGEGHDKELGIWR